MEFSANCSASPGAKKNENFIHDMIHFISSKIIEKRRKVEMQNNYFILAIFFLFSAYLKFQRTKKLNRQKM
jgi:hypothetical protein